MIQRNADSFYPFSADYPDADPDESRSKLIVYWLVDRKLINAYLTESSIQDINLQTDLNIKWCILKCTSMFLYFFVYIYFILNSFVKNSKLAYRYAN